MVTARRSLPVSQLVQRTWAPPMKTDITLPSHAVTIAKNSTTEVNLELLRATEATPVLLATHATPADSGRTLTVDLDLAVLGEDGLIIATLTAADFEILGSDCAWMWCVMEATGEPVPAGSYTAEIDAGGFGGWTDFRTANRHPLRPRHCFSRTALAVLDFDPKWQRSAATHAFLDSVAAPDTVALASYHGSVMDADTGNLRTVHFRRHLNSTPPSTRSRATTAACNALHEVFGRMLTWTAAQASGEPQNVVLVSGRRSEPDDGCGGSRTAITRHGWQWQSGLARWHSPLQGSEETKWWQTLPCAWAART